MLTLRTLIKKELQALFFSRQFLIYGFLFLSLAGGFFSYYFLLDSQNSLENFTQILALEILVMIPLLTMGEWSDEKRFQTDETLRSFLISEWQMILGKFFAVLILVSLLLGISLLLPVSISRGAYLDKIVGIALGFLFLGGSLISIGLWASSLSSYRLPGFLISFTVSWIFFNLGNSSLWDFSPTLYFGLQTFDLNFHFENICRGVLDSRDVVYFLSFISFFLYLNFLNVKRVQYHKIYWGIFTSLLIINLVLFNVLALQYFKCFDLTQTKAYSLSQTSQEILKNLQNPLTISLDLPKNPSPTASLLHQQVNSLLREYQSYSVFPIFIKENEAEQFNVTLFYEDKVQTLSPITQIQDFEYQLSSHLVRLKDSSAKKVGIFLENPRENIFQFTFLLQALGNHYDLEIINPQEEENIQDLPLNALLVLGPAPSSEGLLYQLDQALLRQIPLLIFSDLSDTSNSKTYTLSELLHFYKLKIKPSLPSPQFPLPLETLASVQVGPAESFFKDKKVPYTKTKKLEERSLSKQDSLTESPETKLLVVNSSLALENDWLKQSPQNLSYVLNRLDSFTNNSQILALRKKTQTNHFFRVLNEKEKTFLKYFSLTMPGILLLSIEILFRLLQRRHLNKIQNAYSAL